MNILEKIVKAKKEEISGLKRTISISSLEASPFFNAPRPSFIEHLLKQGPSIITEFKRKSPSRGILNENADILTTVRAYEQAGASALSVLTDIHFDGYSDDIRKIFNNVSIPVLRKDFIIDEFQVLEAKAIGASAILLIDDILEKDKLGSLYRVARGLAMDVLIEVYNPDELGKIPGDARIIGINNRDLKTFKVDTERSLKLAEKLEGDIIKVSESGISSVDTIIDLYDKGFKAFLIGEKFMETQDPGTTALAFLEDLQNSLARNNY